jgi:hypothetical protein
VLYGNVRTCVCRANREANAFSDTEANTIAFRIPYSPTNPIADFTTHN